MPIPAGRFGRKFVIQSDERGGSLSLFPAHPGTPMPKVAVTDYSFPALDIETGILQPLGVEVVAWKEKRPAAELPALVADADYVITQFAPLTADVIASMTRAKVIVRYGIGVDNVDLEAARAGAFRSATFRTTASTRWPTRRWRSSWRQRAAWRPIRSRSTPAGGGWPCPWNRCGRCAICKSAWWALAASAAKSSAGCWPSNAGCWSTIPSCRRPTSSAPAAWQHRSTICSCKRTS